MNVIKQIAALLVLTLCISTSTIAYSPNVIPNKYAAFNQLAEEKGQLHRVDPNFIRSILSVESTANIQAVSPVGARGLMQLMPQTAERMGVPRSELFIPERNMEAGTRYIAFLNKLFNGNPALVAAAYNAGEGAVKKYNGIPPYKETQDYVPKVMARFRLLTMCGIACYTPQHMRNPSAFLKGASGQSISQPVFSDTQKTDPVARWLEVTPKKNTSFVIDVAKTSSTPRIHKTVNVASTTNATVNVNPQKTQLRDRETGFVQVLQHDGSYQSL